MYKINIINNIINDNIIDIKLDISDIDKYIKKYNLKNKGFNKTYYINNICIKTNGDKSEYYNVKDKEVFIKKNYLISYQEINQIPNFIFYESDYEEEYELYENKDKNIFLRKYNNYIELEFTTNNLNDFF